jgi:hypothetical protein
MCRAIKKVLNEYPEFKKQLVIIRYSADKKTTDFFSSFCDVRIIWGGDNTINEIRKSPLKPRSTEITFADRFSFAVIDTKALEHLDQSGLKALAKNFYNDTYLMDQNACSTPHIIFWLTKKRALDKELKGLFWAAIYEQAKTSYSLDGIKVIDKYTELLLFLAQHTPVKEVTTYANYLYVITLNSIQMDLNNYRGQFGLFYEYEIGGLEEVATLITSKVQTCAIFGIERQEILDLILKHHLVGIDRVTPIGSTLDMDLVWDGYNIISLLSRQIA